MTSSSVTLHVSPPLDDGGLPVTHVVVWKRHVDEGFHEDWLPAGEALGQVKVRRSSGTICLTSRGVHNAAHYWGWPILSVGFPSSGSA